MTGPMEGVTRNSEYPHVTGSLWSDWSLSFRQKRL